MEYVEEVARFRAELDRQASPSRRVEIVVEAIRTAADDPRLCVALAAAAIDVARIRSDARLLQEGFLQRGLAHVRLGALADAVADLRTLRSLYGDDRRHVARRWGIGYLLGELEIELGRLEAAWEEFQGIEESGVPQLRTAVEFARGRIALRRGNDHLALDHFLRALGACDETLDPRSCGDICMAIAEVHSRQGAGDDAMKYYDRAIASYRRSEDVSGESAALAARSMLEGALGDQGAALASVHRALGVFGSMGSSGNLSKALLSLAMLHESAGSFSTAVGLLKQILSTKGNGASEQIRVMALMALTRIQLKTETYGDPRMTIDYAHQLASRPSTRVGREEPVVDLKLLYEVLKLRSEVYERLKLFAQALEFFRQYSALREKVAGEERQNAVAEMQRRFDVETAEREAERLKRAMLQKEAELNERAATMVKKDNLLELILKQIGEVKTQVNGKAQKALSEIEDLARGSLVENATWRYIAEDVETIHPGFGERLKRRCIQQLTRAQREICVLIRLRYSAKEIADSRFCSPRTVEKHVENIGKRMDLQQGETVWNVISSL